MTESDHLKNAVSYALLYLQQHGNAAPTMPILRGAAGAVVEMMRVMKATVDREELVRQLEAIVNVRMGEASILDKKNDDDHQAWLPARRGEISWKFWNRYSWYLQNQIGISATVIERMHEITDMILERLEDPHRPSPWDRRGMVVGDVQSGKTSNYNGLICKAADGGYSAIIILAGMHNSLRSQTQDRVDVGFLGFDTEKNLSYENDGKRIGVGLLPQAEYQNLPVMTLTSSKPTGDFKKAVAEGLGINQLGSTPTVFVVKNNKSVLEHLCNWLNGRTGEASVLVIDDEADNASVNTSSLPEPGEDPAERNPTTINRLIRSLLMKFNKRAYVGYTATPFANIFIPHAVDHPVYGPDLFPSAFILNLHAPSNHVGPTEVFGLAEDRRVGLEEREGLPVVRTVEASEAQGFMPHGHKKDHDNFELPPSMKRAIHCFLLSAALRGCRGQENHHQSMFIHVTRFVDVQARLKAKVKAEVEAISSTLRMEGKSNTALMKELEEIWDTDYAPTSANIAARQSDPLLTPVGWDSVRKRLASVASRVQIETINGEAADVRHYKEAKNGCYIIAIGGDKLSRGLTLEGLTVSYFLRPSHMYDTLMQMGRWFGYRPGYLDACRLFITTELQQWYQYIAGATLELRRDFDYMAVVGGSPADFGLRVRQHPAELEITAANKMRSGTEMQISFADSLVETVVFSRQNTVKEKNAAAARKFFARLGPQRSLTGKPDYFSWQDVPSTDVVAFLKAYENHPESRRSRTDLLADYIEAQVDAEELLSWTVVLVNNKANAKSPEKRYDLGANLQGGLTYRVDFTPGGPCYSLRKRHLIDPKHELLDLDDNQLDEALKQTIGVWERSTKKKDENKAPEVPSGKGARNARDPKYGLLIVYPVTPDLSGRKMDDPFYTAFAISFPRSDSGKTVTYKVNNVYSDEFGGDYEPEV